MPYIQEARRAVKTNIFDCRDPGELNYLITVVLINAFNEHPKYESIHVLKRDFVTEPKQNRFLQSLRSNLADRFTVGDIYTAASLAFDEFSRRVVRAYEKKKIEENGDLPEYIALLEGIKAGYKSAAVVEEVKA